MSKLQSLKTSSSLSDVAVLLGLKPAFLSYILYKQTAAEKYKSFQIPKKYGGMRLITAPLAGLKFAQRRLSDLLQECESEISKAKGRKDWFPMDSKSTGPLSPMQGSIAIGGMSSTWI